MCMCARGWKITDYSGDFVRCIGKFINRTQRFQVDKLTILCDDRYELLSARLQVLTKFSMQKTNDYHRDGRLKYGHKSQSN